MLKNIKILLNKKLLIVFLMHNFKLEKNIIFIFTNIT